MDWPAVENEQGKFAIYMAWWFRCDVWPPVVTLAHRIPEAMGV